jgi:hypothetical protein
MTSRAQLITSSLVKRARPDRLGAALAGWLGLLTLVGCSQDTATATLRALDPAGEVSILCLGRDVNGKYTRGLPRAECPDLEFAPTSPFNRRMHALVTQPQSGEVALVDLSAPATQAVVDFEPTQPGYSFMPVGAEPDSIVSTPGGKASFVGVRESGREGIFALPSSCIAPRAPLEPVRDIRTWPACRLPAAPGPMVVLVDPAIDDDGDPATSPRIRASCEGGYVDPRDLVGQAPAANRELCPVDLATETDGPGRRKLAVTLPSLSEIWVMDAQELLDRSPGSFDVCNVEERLPLRADVTGAAQVIPADLAPSSASCGPVGFNHGPPPDAYQPFPVDVAVDDEQRLFIADSAAPLIHVLDVSNPCQLTPLPSLEPRSFSDPTAVVTTRKVAVSNLTALGKRFVYAIDNSATDTAGTLMAFDVSPGAVDRTPIVRGRSPLNPTEPPDRIALGRDVSDVEFVYQDFPEASNGVAIEGIACNPDPRIDPTSIAAEYRPASDLSSGASPRKLRGTFAFAAVHSGQIAVIDVEDLDASCRRPVRVNPDAAEDRFGCGNDDASLGTAGYSIANSIATVTNELSCNVVTPHRMRSRGYFANAASSRAAGLLSFPSLTLETGRSVTTDQTQEGKLYPKMLAARYQTEDNATVLVGPLAYGTNPELATNPINRLEVDPATATVSSLLLSYEEPRNFYPNEEFVTTYEGVVRPGSEALLSMDEATGLGRVNEGLNASYCIAGIQDMDVTAGKGRALGVTSEADLATFARRHADYVQIVDDVLPEDDPYWSGPGAQCGAELFQGDGPARLSGRPLCDEFFGPIEIQSPRRDYRIVEAHEDYLLIEPRSYRYDPENRDSLTRRRQLSEFAACCFPGPALYQVRGGNQWIVRGSSTSFAHDVTTDPTSYRCVSDCNPMASHLRGRAFELSCSGNCPAATGDTQPAVGPAVPGQDFACVVDGTADGIDPGEPGSECVFENLTTRFAMYRGQEPSRRGMTFRWQLSDGFAPLIIGLTTAERIRSTPRSITPLPELGQLLVTDGSARGITLISSRNPGTIASIF